MKSLAVLRWLQTWYGQAWVWWDRGALSLPCTQFVQTHWHELGLPSQRSASVCAQGTQTCVLDTALRRGVLLLLMDCPVESTRAPWGTGWWGFSLCPVCTNQYREVMRVWLLAAKINPGAALGANGARQVPGKHRLLRRRLRPKGFERAVGEHPVALWIVKVSLALSPPIK